MTAKPRIAAVAVALTLASLTGPSATASSTAEHPLTLGEAIERALAKNDTVIISRESLSSSEEAVTGARGAYDPNLLVDGGWRRFSPPVNSAFSGAPDGELSPTTETVDAGAGVSQLLSTGAELTLRTAAGRTTTNGVYTLLSPYYDTSLGFGIRQPLLRGRAIDPARWTIRVATSDRDRSAALLRVDVSDTVADVERSYWILVALREAVGVRQDAVRLAQEQLEETRARIEMGLSPDTEIAQPRAELERRRGDLLATQESVSRAENRLKVLILGDDETELWSRTLVPVERAEVEAVTIDVDQAIEQALDLRPEIDAGLAFEERTRIDTEFASNQVLPSLDAVISYDRFGLTGSLNPAGATIPGLPSTLPAEFEGDLIRSYGVLGDGNYDDASARLVFTIPIKNRSAKSAAAIARSAERQAAARLDATRKAVRAEVRDAAAAVDTTYQRVEAARSAVDAAQIQLDAEHERFLAGLSTNFLVLTRQNELENARINEISARTEYLNARTEMARATGTLLEERGIDVQDDVQAAR